jgi:Double zinc ribbon
VADQQAEIVQCPYCKEDIRADALVCKHCRSRLAPHTPGHGGTCPYCKETIHPEAVRCKHCGSNLQESRQPQHDCQGCGEGTARDAMALMARAVGGGGLGYNSECMGQCQWDCGGLTSDRFFCWIVCAMLCTFGGRLRTQAIG